MTSKISFLGLIFCGYGDLSFNILPTSIFLSTYDAFCIITPSIIPLFSSWWDVYLTFIAVYAIYLPLTISIFLVFGYSVGMIPTTTFFYSLSAHFSLHFFMPSSLIFLDSISFLIFSEGLSVNFDWAVVGLEDYCVSYILLGFLFQS